MENWKYLECISIRLCMTEPILCRLICLVVLQINVVAVVVLNLRVDLVNIVRVFPFFQFH